MHKAGREKQCSEAGALTTGGRVDPARLSLQRLEKEKEKRPTVGRKATYRDRELRFEDRINRR